MERPDIPGYYFDQEKNKYFKIQPSHTTPANLAYSAQDVKRRKTHDEREKARELVLKKHKGRIRRSKILREPLEGGLLKREYGQPSLDTGRVFASGLVQQGHFSSMMPFVSCNDVLFDIDHRPDLGDSLVDVRIVYNAQLFTFRANADKYTRSTAHGSHEICHGVGNTPQESRASFRVERFPNSGQSTSLSINRASKRLAMTWMASTWQSGIAITPMLGIPTDGESEGFNVLLGPGSTRSQYVTMYSSTAAPSSSSLLFACGSSHGILTIDKVSYNMQWLSPNPNQYQNFPKDIFALEFLSDNPSVLLSGGRPGLLQITDLRIPKFGYGNSDIISHPSSITHIKQLDTHRILVAGLNSKMCQYDLRYRKEEISSPLQPQNFTKSILTYPEYHNPARVQLGLDVDLESQIIAAAQEQEFPGSSEGQHPVKLFSLHGGNVLPSPEVSKKKIWGFEEEIKNIRCVKFARDIEGKMKSLYVGQSSNIRRYTWADRDDANIN